MSGMAFAQASHVALVVGNSRYDKGPDLPNASTDSRVVAQVFRKLGYQTLLLQDATRADMMIALANLRISARNASQVVIYFSGHGVQTSAESYLLMRDTTMAWRHIANEAVSVSTMVRAVSDQPRQKIILIDACRESPLSDAGPVTLSGRIFAPAGLLVAYSAQPGQVAFDGRDDVSPFTRALVQQLAGPVRPLETILRQVRLRVIQATGGQQVPWSRSALIGPATLSVQGLNAAGRSQVLPSE